MTSSPIASPRIRARAANAWLIIACATALAWAAALLPALTSQPITRRAADAATDGAAATPPGLEPPRASVAAPAVALGDPRAITRSPSQPPLAAALQNRFEREAVDSAWTAELGALLDAQSRAHGLDDRAVRAVECRAALCRLELELTAAQASAAIGALALPASLRRAGPPLIERTATGVRVVQFVERAGPDADANEGELGAALQAP
jgi:hypothetical protein